MPSEQYRGDPMAVRLAAWSLLTRGRLDVPAERVVGERGQYFVQNPGTGRWYSKYGILNTLGYLPALALERELAGSLEPFNTARERTRWLNLGNLLLSLGLAAILFQLASRYTAQPLIAGAFVLACLYGSFGWNYLRAQTTELLQWTLYCLLSLQLVDLWRGRGALGPVARAWGTLGLLGLTKLVYMGLVPMVALVCLLAPSAGRLGGGGEPGPWWRRVRAPRSLLILTGLGAVGVCGVVLGLNRIQFGGFLTTGYTQWAREVDLFQGDLLEGVTGFLFHPQRSVFLYQPLLLLGLWALPAAWRRSRMETLMAWGPLVFFLLLHARTTNWEGHWCYGPRYLLAVLTPATLPALLAMERWLAAPRSWWRGALGGLGALALAGSVWWNAQVHRVGFFTWYEVEAALSLAQAPEALAELRRTPFGVVCWELERQRRTDRFPSFLETARGELGPEEVAGLARQIQALVRPNSWWRPDPEEAVRSAP